MSVPQYYLSAADQRVKRSTETSLRSVQAGNREVGNMALRVGNGEKATRNIMFM